jgi:hypothetical protein
VVADVAAAAVAKAFAAVADIPGSRRSTAESIKYYMKIYIIDIESS